jgi:hypothetical protein
MAPTISNRNATKKNFAQPTVASQSPIRAPILFIVGADARRASAAAPRAHANALLKREVRGEVCLVGVVSADAEVLSVLFSVVIQTLYKRPRMNTNLVRQIALIGQQAAQIAIGRRRQRRKQKGPDLPGLCLIEKPEL